MNDSVGIVRKGAVCTKFTDGACAFRRVAEAIREKGGCGQYGDQGDQGSGIDLHVVLLHVLGFLVTIQ